MSKSSDKPIFSLVLEALPDQGGPAAVLRLRRALKYCLRVCRLKCVACEEQKPPPSDAGRLPRED
jgi:hypothetical protein